MSADTREWPTTWEEIRFTRDEYNRIADLLFDIQEAAYDGKPCVVSVKDGVWLAGLFHAYFAEGHFQGERWKQRLIAEGHKVNS